MFFVFLGLCVSRFLNFWKGVRLIRVSGFWLRCVGCLVRFGSLVRFWMRLWLSSVSC